MPAQHGVDLAQHGLGAPGIGERQIGPRQLEARLDRVVRHRVRELRPQALHPRHEVFRASTIASVQRHARFDGKRQRARRVVLDPVLPDDPAGRRGVLLPLDPGPPRERESRTLTQRNGRDVGVRELEGGFGDVGEQPVGLVAVAGEPPRDGHQSEGMGPEGAATGERPDRELRVCAHPRGATTTTLRAEEGEPRVDRAAAVGQGALVAAARRSIRPPVGLRGAPPDGGEQCAEHRERRVLLQRSV